MQEAIATNLPVVMSDVGVAGHEVRQNEKVTIVPVGDHDKFVQAILNSGLKDKK